MAVIVTAEVLCNGLNQCLTPAWYEVVEPALYEVAYPTMSLIALI